jgi:MFS transporter, DHA2 family, multidrug resistance protein
MRFAPGLDLAQRRLVIAISVVGAFLLTMNASFNYVLGPIVESFGASNSQSLMLRQIPSIAALLVVFPAGALGARLGPRRFIIGCALLFTFGSLLVAVAPVIEIVTLGFLLLGVGRSAMFIVGLAYMGSAVSSKEGRATAFASFAMVLPITYLIMPLLAGILTDVVGWRSVAVVGMVCGVVGVILAIRLLPRDGAPEPAGEMWTPSIAAVALVLLVQALNSLPTYGFVSPQTLGSLAGAGVCVVVLRVLNHRLASPSVSWAVLKDGGVFLLLAVLLLFSFANLWFYTTMALQYIFGLSVLQTAIAMLPAQVTAIFGAALAAHLIRKRGIPFAGGLLGLGVAAMLFASALVSADSPVWLPALIVAVYGAFAVGAGVPITNAIMDRASAHGQGGAAAWRSAASNLGSAVSVAFMTAIVATAIGLSLEQQMQDTSAGSSMTSKDMTQALSALNSGRSQQDVADQYSVSASDIAQLSSEQTEALLAGYRTQGVVGGIVTVVVSVVFYVVTRRHQETGLTPEDVPSR